MSPNALLTKELIYPHSGFGVRLLKMCNKKSAAVFIWHKKRAQMISWESSPWNTLGTIQKVWREYTLKWYGHSSLSVTENEQLKFMRYAIIFIDKRFKSNRSDMTLRHKIYHELFLIDIAISWFKKNCKNREIRRPGKFNYRNIYQTADKVASFVIGTHGSISVKSFCFVGCLGNT